MARYFHMYGYRKGNRIGAVSVPDRSKLSNCIAELKSKGADHVEVWIGEGESPFAGPKPGWELYDVAEFPTQPSEVSTPQPSQALPLEEQKKFMKEYYGLSDKEVREILEGQERNPSARSIGLLLLLGGGILLLTFKRKQAIAFTEKIIEKVVETGTTVKEKGDVANEIFNAASNNGIPARVLASVLWVESNWKTGAKAYSPEFYRNERDIRRFLESADDISKSKPSIINHPDWWQIKKIKDFHESNRDSDAMSFVKNWKDSGFSWGSHGPGQVLSFTARGLGYDPLGDNWTLGKDIRLNLDLASKELKRKYDGITKEGRVQNIVKGRVSELGLKWPESETDRWKLVRAMYVCGTGLACGRDRIEGKIWPKFEAAWDKFVEFA